MYQPLADELRPTTLDDVYGQEEILGEGRTIWNSALLKRARTITQTPENDWEITRWFSFKDLTLIHVLIRAYQIIANAIRV